MSEEHVDPLRPTSPEEMKAIIKAFQGGPQSGLLQKKSCKCLRSHPSCSALTLATFQQPRTPGMRSGESQKHSPAFLEKRAPKKKARQPSRTSNTFKYRGVILDYRVNWEAHIHRILDRERQMFGTLYPLLIARGKLDPSRKIRIYKILLRLIVTYASAIWLTATTTYMNKLQTFQNRILLMGLNASWFVRNTTLHEDAGVEPLMDFIRKIETRFFDRAPANHPGVESSHFVEDVDSLESKVDCVAESWGNWHPDEVVTTFSPCQKHSSLEPKVDRAAVSLGELLQDGKEKNAKPTALKRKFARTESRLSSWMFEGLPLRWRS
ncbi:hypothetical protein Trydic_g7781 [Trypoxylus dichotomus]